MSSIKMMSAVALFLGIGSVTVGILSLAYLGGAKYPVTALTGIWYGMSVSIINVWMTSLTLDLKQICQFNLTIICTIICTALYIVQKYYVSADSVWVIRIFCRYVKWRDNTEKTGKLFIYWPALTIQKRSSQATWDTYFLHWNISQNLIQKCLILLILKMHRSS